MRKNEQQQEHTNSYYAASVNEVTDYPVLEGPKSVDVCVVGGGFAGVSTALTLAERGFSVALIEGNRIGWGATGRNGGQIIHGGCGLDKIQKKHGSSIADTVWDLRWRGNDIIRGRIAKYDIDCDLKDGYAEVAVNSKQVEWLQEYAQLRPGSSAMECPHRRKQFLLFGVRFVSPSSAFRKSIH